jgi:hypothetical protein
MQIYVDAGFVANNQKHLRSSIHEFCMSQEGQLVKLTRQKYTWVVGNVGWDDQHAADQAAAIQRVPGDVVDWQSSI